MVCDVFVRMDVQWQDVPKWSAVEAAVAVVIGGVNCSAVQRVTRSNRPALECVMGKQTVGYKNITITVASQHATVDAASEVLMAMCSRNNYGMIGELVRLAYCAVSRPLLPFVCVCLCMFVYVCMWLYVYVCVCVWIY